MAVKKIYEAFGEERGLREWSRLSGIPAVTLGRYIKQGMTMEQALTTRGVKSEGARRATKDRKPRESKNMITTKRYIVDLLRRSGYIAADDVYVTVKSNGRTYHGIEYEGEYLGVYDFATDTLRLRNQQTLALKKPAIADQAIMRTEGGLWVLTPKTAEQIGERYEPKYEEPKPKNHRRAVRGRRTRD